MEMYSGKHTSVIIPVICFFGGSLTYLNAGNHQKPNFIFILTDDHRFDALGYAGNPIIRTPQLDRLAQEGVFFKNAFVTSPISTASRASIFTGLYERTHGYTFHQGNLKEEYMQLSYPVLLKNAGYYTGFYGKFGVKYPKAGSLFNQAEIYDRKGKEGYFHKTIDEDTVHLTRYTGHKAIEFLNTVSENQPFCLSLSFSAPHAHDESVEQYFWQKKSEELYKDVVFPQPALGDDYSFQKLPKEVREGYNHLRWFWRYDSPEKYQQSMKGYYRMITEIDDEIELIRNHLKGKGLDKNTIIIFMGDNGLFTGERQLADKWLMYDASIRVPMIIYDPRAKNHSDIDDMVLNIDIPKTMLSMAGIPIPETYQGINLENFVYGRKIKNNRKSILVEHLWKFDKVPSSEGVRTRKWKYLRYRFIDAPEELYNLKIDPDESTNLAQNPFYYFVLKKLRKECDQQILIYTNGVK
jgi:alpha-L-rhamnosidase